MNKIAKLFTLALCLTFVGALFANNAKGPVANNATKYSTVTAPVSDTKGSYQLPAVGTRRPGSLDEVIISEGFEEYANGTLPPGWTQVDVDNAPCNIPGFGGFSRWIVLSGQAAHGGTKYLANAYNSNAAANNDWLILPQQNLTGDITFSYWAVSQDPSFLENFEVRVSTGGNAPADFTNLISTHTNVPAAYTQYTDDLSAYAGAPFYIALHYTSVDEFIIKVDDLLLEAGEAAPTGTISGTVTAFGTGTPISGAEVEIQGGASALTDGAGSYTFDVPAGTYTVNASATNYEDETAAGVVVVVNQTTTVDFEMIPSSTGSTDYPSTAAPVGINDHSFSAMPLEITDDFLIEDINVTVGISHTYVSDMSLWLVGPNGDSLLLVDNTAAFIAGANMDNTVFDDEAATAFAYVAGGAPYTGSFRPLNELAYFDGFTTAGTWYLVGYDNEDADTGTLDYFTLTVTHEVSAIGDRGEGVPSEFALHQAFPNPFNPSTRIDFDVPVTTDAKLVVFNSIGQEIATLVNGKLSAGLHTAYFTASNLPSGIYFAQLQAGTFVSTQKLVLMK